MKPVSLPKPTKRRIAKKRPKSPRSVGTVRVCLFSPSPSVNSPILPAPIVEPVTESSKKARKVRKHYEHRPVPQLAKGKSQYVKAIESNALPLSKLKHRCGYISKEGLRTPGPGTYEAHRSSSPSFRIGTSPRELPPDSVRCSFPGPGTYESSQEMNSSANSPINASSLAFSFPRGPIRTLDKERVLVPGPGTYEETGGIGSSPAFSMAPRREIPRSISPGPGEYGRLDQQPSSPRWSFGSDERLKTPRSLSPGPAAYCLEPRSSAKGWTMPRSHSGYLDKELLKVPGPGTYTLR